MRVTERDLGRFLDGLRRGEAPRAPSEAVRAFAQRASRLGPRSLVEEGQALVTAKEDASTVANVVVGALRGLLRDVDEHGDQSEYADEQRFMKTALSTWSRRAGPAATDEVLLARGLEDALVAFVEFAALPPAQAKAWKALRASKRLAVAAKALVKKPLAPWFAELVAAYVSRELERMSLSAHATSWQSKLADAPALLAVLESLGRPPVFTPRALRAANALVLRHGHAPTRKALEAMGALRASAEQRAEVERAVRTARAMKR